MDITVSKAEIFKEVEKRSSLEGLLQEGRFEDLWASEEEGKFLETYWIEGCMAAVQVFKRYLTSTTVTHTLASYDGEETFSISAEMPERYNGLLTGSVETDVKMMIAANVMYGWMNVLSPGQAKKYGDESASYAEDLKLKILYRDEPTGNFQESLTMRRLTPKARNSGRSQLTMRRLTPKARNSGRSQLTMRRLTPKARNLGRSQLTMRRLTVTETAL